MEIVTVIGIAVTLIVATGLALWIAIYGFYELGRYCQLIEAKENEYMLTDKIEAWARERNLIEGGCPKSQMLKCVSEVGELADSVNKQADVRDGIGDVAVTLVIIAAQHGTSLQECLAVAYDEIKDRKGIVLDGVFIKESDPHYAEAVRIVETRKNVPEWLRDQA